MRKRSWKNRKNRPCPDCGKMLTYTRKDSFDRAVGNNTYVSLVLRVIETYMDTIKHETTKPLNIRERFQSLYLLGG